MKMKIERSIYMYVYEVRSIGGVLRTYVSLKKYIHPGLSLDSSGIRLGPGSDHLNGRITCR